MILLAPGAVRRARRDPGAADGERIALGADTVGVAAGGLVAWRFGSVIGCVVVAAGVTAGLRAL